VIATRRGWTRRTLVDAAVRLRRLVLGHTVARDARVERVTLDGRRVLRPVLRLTHRGLEVLARVTGNKRGRHVLVVRPR
jgi:hypothetical protein